MDVATEKLTKTKTPTDQDIGFEESTGDIHPVANHTSINRDLVLSTTSKGMVHDTSDQTDDSGTVVQESPNFGKGLDKHLGGYEASYIQVPLLK